MELNQDNTIAEQEDAELQGDSWKLIFSITYYSVSKNT